MKKYLVVLLVLISFYSEGKFIDKDSAIIKIENTVKKSAGAYMSLVGDRVLDPTVETIIPFTLKDDSLYSKDSIKAPFMLGSGSNKYYNYQTLDLLKTGMANNFPYTPPSDSNLMHKTVPRVYYYNNEVTRKLKILNGHSINNPLYTNNYIIDKSGKIDYYNFSIIQNNSNTFVTRNTFDDNPSLEYMVGFAVDTVGYSNNTSGEVKITDPYVEISKGDKWEEFGRPYPYWPYFNQLNSWGAAPIVNVPANSNKTLVWNSWGKAQFPPYCTPSPSKEIETNNYFFSNSAYYLRNMNNNYANVYGSTINYYDSAIASHTINSYYCLPETKKSVWVKNPYIVGGKFYSAGLDTDSPDSVEVIRYRGIQNKITWKERPLSEGVRNYTLLGKVGTDSVLQIIEGKVKYIGYIYNKKTNKKEGPYVFAEGKNNNTYKIYSINKKSYVIDSSKYGSLTYIGEDTIRLNNSNDTVITVNFRAGAASSYYNAYCGNVNNEVSTKNYYELIKTKYTIIGNKTNDDKIIKVYVPNWLESSRPVFNISHTVYENSTMDNKRKLITIIQPAYIISVDTTNTNINETTVNNTVYFKDNSLMIIRDVNQKEPINIYNIEGIKLYSNVVDDYKNIIEGGFIEGIYLITINNKVYKVIKR